MNNSIPASSAVSPVRIPSETTPATSSPKSAESTESSFKDLVNGLLEQVNTPHVQADQAISDLASGKTDNVHSAVLAMVKADMSFRMTLEIRNRLTDAYQEIMRMQV